MRVLLVNMSADRCPALVMTYRNDVIHHLATLDDMSQTMDTMVPMQVLMDIDNSRNPMLLTKERLERAATENQFMNGKIHAIDVRTPFARCIEAEGAKRLCGQSYKKCLDEALIQNFPGLEEYLRDGSAVDLVQPFKPEEDPSVAMTNGV